jgi:hypothetical protein
MTEVSPRGRELNTEASPSTSVGQVRLWVGGKSRRARSRRPAPWWLRLMMMALASSGLLGGGILLVLSFRWGLTLILDPQALPQLQAFLADPLAPKPLTATTTWAELQHTVGSSGQILGTPMRLPAPGPEADWLVFPVVQPASGKIVQLRVLQSTAGQGAETQLMEVAALAVPPFSAEQILAPLAAEARQSTVSPKEFVSQHLALLPTPPTPSPYHWLALTGQWSSQGTRLRYGQIVIFDPERRRLSLSEVWSSPAEQMPQWIDLDGEGPTDLVIPETIGLDPVLRGLQVVELRGLGPAVQLQPVGWVGVPLDAQAQAKPYQQALRLARGGLWRQAHTQLQKLQAPLAERWTPAAEAQLRLMDRHATLTRRQAEQDWSMPSQKIMALLIDGQWAAALDQLEASPNLLEPLMRSFSADQGRLWKRISAAASVSQPDPAVWVWGGLALEAKQNRQAAQHWLQRQPVTATTRNRLTAILNSSQAPAQPVAAPTAASTPSPSPAPSSTPITSAVGAVASSAEVTASSPVLGVMGPVQPWDGLPPGDWYFPEPQQPGLVQGEQWYTVEVPLVQRNQQWQGAWPQPLASTPAERLWPLLPFADNPSLTMVRWQSSLLGVTQNLYVKGLRMNNGTVTLLAAGAKTSDLALAPLAPLAFSDGALVWLSAEQKTTPTSNALLTTVMDEIDRHQGALPEPLSPATVETLLPQVQLHTLDLTGDGRAEQVLTFDPAILNQLQRLGLKLNGTTHKTMILNLDNQLLYSDLFQPHNLIALTNPRHGRPLALVVHGAQGYGLWQWSDTSQGFDPL